LTVFISAGFIFFALLKSVFYYFIEKNFSIFATIKFCIAYALRVETFAFIRVFWSLHKLQTVVDAD